VGILAAAAVLAAAFLFVLSSLPPRPARLAVPAWPGTRPAVAGAMHLHTRRSDGSGTPEEVAAAAARAGLAFIVLTDHGDATRPRDPAQYRSGVLCIDAVEITTGQGHYVALGLPPVPYPLGGEPRDVVEDVARLGGFGIVAHPDSSKPDLQWSEWTTPFDGIEWLNADSEWRDESRLRLARALLTYPFRPVETIGSLLDRPDKTLRRWDALTEHRKIVGVAGTDAHARLGRQDDDTHGDGGNWFVRMPSYEVSLGTFALRVSLDTPLSGNAAADAEQLMGAIRAGHFFTAIDAVASPVAFEFSATTGQSAAGQGDLIEPNGPIAFTARVNATTGGVIALRKDGTIVQQHPVPELKFDAPQGTGVYRVEVYLSNSQGHPPAPWIVSNPIYIEPPGWGAAPLKPLAPAIDSWNIQGGPWHVEHETRSSGTFAQRGAPTGPVDFSYQLAEGARAGQYAALVMSAGNSLTSHSRLAFGAVAAKPMRVSVQVRRPSTGDRWQRSVYLDKSARDIVIPFAEMTAVGSNSNARFTPSDIDTILFVVDTTNTAPASAGRFTVSDLRVEH
jgi:hypothetical protein